jgi:2-polyprenyl-3-methyl-5-hydroxy-6-metoxy-1,4-benzoquinol methylase
VTADGWNHNTHYHDRLIAAVPRPCRRALDVGCGHGAFARRLGQVADSVDAIDGDAVVLQSARDLSTEARHIRFIDADFMTWSAGEGDYDVVSMIAVLHHLPFEAALTKAARLLRPGGVLAIIGLHRAATPLHALVRSAIAYPVSRFYRLTRASTRVRAAIREPTMTLSDIRTRATLLLPGAVVRRHLLWRYSLIWIKPQRSI